MSVTYSPVVELRQYTLHPGARDTLVAIFEAEFVESQEELGIEVGGLFEDLDDPDRFVWMRGFASMEARREALEAFYFHSAAWREHSRAANATMIDSDDVLLLRPTDPPRPGALPTSGDITAAIWLHEPGDGTCVRLAEQLGPGAAVWRTLPAENTFPALPVRAEHALVALTAADSPVPDGAAQSLRLRPTSRSQHV